MHRRSFLRFAAILPGALLLPRRARAQQPKVWRIGYLHPTDAQDVAFAAFRRALAELGYADGRNAVIEQRFAAGNVERLPGMAAELVASRVDVIVAVSPTAIRAARGATQTIPIVMAFSGDDPVKSGFAASLARPGGNTTGLTAIALDMAPRWIELLHDLVPGLTTIAVLRSPGRPDHSAQIDVLQSSALSNGMRLYVVEARGADQYAEAFAASARAGSGAIIVLSGPEFVHNRVRLAELAARHRLPSLFQFGEFVTAGGLVSYGPDIADLSSRAAAYVDRILKGANPAELPIERPRRFHLVVNRKAALALGLTVPQALLLEADRVIQ